MSRAGAARRGHRLGTGRRPVRRARRAQSIADRRTQSRGGRVDGLRPCQALELVDALVVDGRLATYHLLPAVRADLLSRLGRRAEAREELIRAAALTRNEQERALLLARAAGN
jgi:predicted RNA polymerase sigma factor